MKYNKLVRDKIIEIIEAKGERALFHTAGDIEYHEKLKEKLREEIEELIRDENAGEIADVLEVLEAFAEFKGISWAAIVEEKERKREGRGGFAKRIILDES